jgi:hypothetical protein
MDMILEAPGMTVRAPAEAPAAGPIPVSLDIGADDRTYWDNDGVIDEAVRVALVRRDRPGLLFVPIFDRERRDPDQPPLRGRPSDDVLDSRSGVTSETETFDIADARVLSPGSATYFLVAAFAKWWARPHRLRLVDGHGPAPVTDQPVSIAAVRPPASGGARSSRAGPHHAFKAPSLRLGRTHGRAFLRATVRLPATVQPPPDQPAPKPFFTVVGFNLCPTGGAAGAVFAPEAPPKPQETVATSAVSFAALSQSFSPGRWVFLLFAGDEVSTPLEVVLTEEDLR